MSSVWYLGRAKSRTITDTEWADAGIVGVPSKTWNLANGYSISTTEFVPDQLLILSALSDFNASAPDGPRPAPVYPDPVPAGDPPPAPSGGGLGEVKSQDTPAANWNFAHGLTRLPNVALFLGNGEMVETDVVATISAVTATWPMPVAGKMVLT